MSAAKENPCRKFQANIFNKSKCQNCFKPRESHLLNDEDLTQAKPIYGGWLLLAPDGTDFDNPVHRSRKWQRRFFILYEHGLLRYALDEMPTTLPQGTINMNQCTDVVDGEGRTGQKFSLCILTPEKEHFIRAETKEIISGWLEMLMVYPRTNKQNQKKKRKVEPPTPQEPGPAKVAVTSNSSSIPSAEKVPTTKSTLWQEEMRAKDQPDGSNLSPAQSPRQSQPSSASSLREPGLESKEEESSMSSDRMDCGRKVRVESGYFSLEKTKQDLKAEEQQLPPPHSPPSPSTPNNRRSQVIEKFEALDIEKAEHMETNLSAGPSPSSDTRQGRSEKRAFPRKRDFISETPTAPLSDASASPLSPHRRAKSLDRRSTESSMTPDLLNFKKGWLTKQYEDGQWKKHWFVLADQSLRYYRDSVAEEAADLDGEIDLSTCYDVTEYPVQRNYGFQIHTKEGEFTLSAMTSGIRRNWIQTIMKHVHPTTTPDVTSSLPEEKSKNSSAFETCPRPSEKQEPEPGEPDPEQKRSRARERRREGRSKTFDWAEFRPIQQALAQERASIMGTSDARDPGYPEVESGELERERARRREERRKRFGMLDAVDGPSIEDAALRMEVDRSPGLPVADLKTQNVHVEIEQRWHQVETTPLREEKQVPIAPLHLSSEDRNDRLSAHELTSLLEKELEKSQRSQISSINSDIEALRRQYLEELQSVQRELEVLSEQYSQKCLENAHLAQALEAERQALRQCQRENQELNAHNQELNNRLAAEITRLRTLLTGDGDGEAASSPLTQGKDAYELEVLLRVKESEIQYLKQEISSLKDELQTALRDKKYASDKYKDIYTELSIAKAKADCDISRLKEQLKAATEALGEKSPESTAVAGYDIMKSKSNPDFLKKDRSCVTRQLRNIRSKSLKEGLTVQERLKLFESRDLKKD
nr:myosin phosphatase Rho-interacting protein isoform X4 [Cavia porcellus]